MELLRLLPYYFFFCWLKMFGLKSSQFLVNSQSKANQVKGVITGCILPIGHSVGLLLP